MKIFRKLHAVFHNSLYILKNLEHILTLLFTLINIPGMILEILCNYFVFSLYLNPGHSYPPAYP